MNLLFIGLRLLTNLMLYCCYFRSQIQDAAGKVWVTYYENERKCVYNQTDRIQSQLQTVSELLLSFIYERSFADC